MLRNAVRWQLASRAVGGPAGNVTPLLGLGGMAVVGAMGSGLDISGPASTVGALSVLAAIVAIHECGHFVAARLQNIHVTKFSIGFGPALLKWQATFVGHCCAVLWQNHVHSHPLGMGMAASNPPSGKAAFHMGPHFACSSPTQTRPLLQGPEVEYAFRAIPLGGFVGFPDDDPDLKDKFPPDDPNLLKNRPIKDRALVISAGIIANCIFAMSILLTQVSTIGVIETNFLPGVRIPEVVQGSVADRAGFKPGDKVTQVQGQEIRASATAVNDIVNAIKDRPKKGMSFLVERAGQAIEIPVTVAEAPDGTGRIGVQLAVNAKVAKVKPDGPLAAVQLAAREFGKLTTTVVTGLTQIFTNFSKTAESVSGPVAIVAVGAEVARADISGLFQFAAIVNINLAVVNALPLPALDGGYMALLLAEALRGKKLDETVEKSIMASGLLLLMAVGVVLVVRDTINLGGGARM
eukprot:jgi/Astpho2/9814/Aster-03783